MPRERLTPSEITKHLQALEGWQLDDDGLSITRSYKFGNFVEAFAFMTRCAFAAEKLDHHPEWSNVYRTVTVKLTTHSSNGLTELDVALAKEMDKAAGH